MAISIDINESQAQAILNDNQIAATAVANSAQQIGSNQFVFLAAFDGTNNDRNNNLPPGEQCTNVWQLVQQAEDSQTGNFQVRYAPGPGTSAALRHSSWLPTAVTQQVINTAESLYNQFVLEAKTWLATHPSQPVSIALTSFSRGAASAAIFSQMVYERGVTTADGQVLVPPGQVGIAGGVIFDPVTTGVSGNLAFAPNVRNLVVVKALNEYRTLFKASVFSQTGVSTVNMYGNHCDIGGGYDVNPEGIGAISLDGATRYFQNMGLPIASVPPDRQFVLPSPGELTTAIHIHSEAFDNNSYKKWEVTYSDGFAFRDFRQAAPNFQCIAAATGDVFTLYDGSTVQVISTGDNTEDVESIRIGDNGTITKEIARFKGLSGSTEQKLEEKILLRINSDGTSADISATTYTSARGLEFAIPQGLSTTRLEAHVADGVDSSSVKTSIMGNTGDDHLIGNNGADTLKGNAGKDYLEGGAGADLLDGGIGEDILYGGKGNDTLIGGDGDDLYVINTGDGTDTFIDSGANRVIYNGDLMSGLFIKNATSGAYEFFKDGTKKVVFNSPGVLTLDASTQIVFQNQTAGQMLDGQFGLQLHEDTAAPTTNLTIRGDLALKDFNETEPGIQVQYDALGNPVQTTQEAPGQTDTLKDSTGNDKLQGLDGNDSIVSLAGGDDLIEGGSGNDWLVGFDGHDVVLGGAGRDVLVEGRGNDRLYADTKIDLKDALAAENAAPSGLQGEALSGGAGDDLAIGGIGHDVLAGGTGDDILVGGAGDDNIEGDAMVGSIAPDWSAVRSVTGNFYLLTYNQFTDMTWPTLGGADVIHAGGGADWVRAGYGNDYVDGGQDADVIWGEGGNDDLFGGLGNDLINGDNASLALSAHGNDYLDGEGGDDVLFGEGGNDDLFGGEDADQLFGGLGNDYLNGEAGADVLVGGEGADDLFGGSEADFLQGDAGTGIGDGNDYLDGEGENDILLGLGGADELHGGEGNDQIAGDNGGTDTSGGADTIYGGGGHDLIDAQGGNDVVDSGDGDDIVAGGTGDDQLAGGAGFDQLQGGDHNDVLDGGDDADTLFGEAGHDTLYGGNGNDYLIGGTGDDILDGGEGDDVYFWSTGDGRDRIVDSGGTDWLVINDIRLGQVVLGVGSLKLSLPDGGEIHLDDFDPDNPYAAGGIEYFQFADAVVSQAQLIDYLGIAPTGTPEADVLSGTALSETIQALAGDDVVTARAGDDTVFAAEGADVVYAGAGNDTVFGGEGDDVILGEEGNDRLYGEAGKDLLAGGAGTDLLQGGEGDDSYLFQAGDGHDTVIDSQGANAIVLGGGLTLDAVAFTREGNDLRVAVKSSADRLTVTGWFAAGSSFNELTLGDGTLLDRAGVEAALPRNQAPIALPDQATMSEEGLNEITGNLLANDSDPEGRALRVTNPGEYLGAVGSLSLSAGGGWTYLLASGSDAVQSLGAGQSLAERFDYTVSDDDPNGAASASSTLTITVQGANDLPQVGADSAATNEDAATPLTGNVLANDRDIDAGTVLTVIDAGTRNGTHGTLNLAADGGWSYSLNATAQTLAAGQSVTESFAHTVSDGIASVGGTLAIRVDGRNDAPVLAVPLADQSAAANTSWSWTLPAGSFTDIDAGEVLGYSATLADGTALPSWLAFSPSTQTFSGRVPKSASGSIDIRVAATDRAGALAADVFTLGFAAGTGGGGGGGGGGSQGNEGVGNGVDGPPPGHDTSFNDGEGTGPGNPGAQGGNGYRPPKRADIVMRTVLIEGMRLEEASAATGPGRSDIAHANAPGQQKPASGVADSAAPVDAAMNGAIDAVSTPAAVSPAPTFDTAAAATGDTATRTSTSGIPNLGALLAAANPPSTTDGAGAAGTSGAADVAVFARWLAIEQALAEDQRQRAAQGWGAGDLGADTAALSRLGQGFLGSGAVAQTDPLAQLAGQAEQLKVFTGLGKGVGRLG